MRDRCRKLDLFDPGDRARFSGERAGFFEGGFFSLDDLHHGVEPLAEIHHSTVHDGSRPKPTVQVRDELHRITIATVVE